MVYSDEAQEEFVVDSSSATSKYKAFIGSITFEDIMDNLQTQFEDYINIQDQLSYVQTFFSQYDDSKELWLNNETEEEPEVFLQALDDFYLSPFLEKLSKLFKERLNISITAIEDDKPLTDETKVLLISLYENLILNARHNIKLIFTDYIYSGMQNGIIDEGYFQVIQNMRTMEFLSPSQFLKTIDNFLFTEFENGSFSGNFLQKYYPKFYQNKDLYEEIVAEVTNKTKLFSTLKGNGDL